MVCPPGAPRSYHAAVRTRSCVIMPSGTRGPARPIKFLDAGPRPGPAHRIFKVSRPGPTRPGPARSIIFSKCSTRPGPAHHIFKILGPAHHNFQIGPARPGLDHRPMIISPVFPMLLARSIYPTEFFSKVRYGLSILPNTRRAGFIRYELHTGTPRFDMFGSTSINISVSSIRPRYR